MPEAPAVTSTACEPAASAVWLAPVGAAPSLVAGTFSSAQFRIAIPNKHHPLDQQAGDATTCRAAHAYAVSVSCTSSC